MHYFYNKFLEKNNPVNSQVNKPWIAGKISLSKILLLKVTKFEKKNWLEKNWFMVWKELFIYFWVTLFQKLSNIIYYKGDSEG